MAATADRSTPCFRHPTVDAVDWYLADGSLSLGFTLRLVAVHLALFLAYAVLLPGLALQLFGPSPSLLLLLAAWVLTAWALLAARSLRVPLRHLRITRQGVELRTLFTRWPATRLDLQERPHGVGAPPFFAVPEPIFLPFEALEDVLHDQGMIRLRDRERHELQLLVDPLPDEDRTALLSDLQQARQTHLRVTELRPEESAARALLETAVKQWVTGS